MNRTEAEKAAREWRKEFPCKAVHSGDDLSGLNCLQVRDLAGSGTDKFSGAIQQRYFDLDRSLICDNCLSTIRVAGGQDESQHISAEQWLSQCGEFATELRSEVGQAVFDMIVTTMDQFADSARKRPCGQTAWVSVETELSKSWAIVVINGVVQHMAARFNGTEWEWFDEDADPAPKEIVTHWYIPSPPTAEEKN